MASKKKRYVKVLWDKDSPPSSVQRYLRQQWELNSSWVRSTYPYSGPARELFRGLPRKEQSEYFAPPKEAPLVAWRLRHDRVRNDLTADLLAAAELLGGEVLSKWQDGMPGGIGADFGVVWVKLLDGSVSVRTTIVESQFTNRVSGTQRTIITGPLAIRALLEVLGIDRPLRKLAGEAVAPKQEAVVELVEQLLKAKS